MKDVEHARMMLDAARRDLAAIEGMADGQVFADEIFGFHAQQAVEKALKAWLSLTGVSYPRLHDLEQLAALLEEGGELVPEGFDRLAGLTDFAVLLRYEAFEYAEESLDRRAIVRQVRELVMHVEKLLRSAVKAE